MRILITSTSHPDYDRTGEVVEDKHSMGLVVRLDGGGPTVLVPEGQWKVIKRQETKV